MSNKKYAEIIVDNKSRSTDTAYTYIVPEEYSLDVKRGVRVLVPFGKGDKLLEGIIVDFKETTSYDSDKLKYIDSLIDKKPIISEKMLELASWMKVKYLAQYIEVFKTILPSGITNKVKKFATLNNIDESKKFEDLKSNHQKKIIEILKIHGDCEIKFIREKIGSSSIHKHINDLETLGIISTYERINVDVKKKYQKIVYKSFKDEDLEDITNGMNSNAVRQIQILNFLKGKESISLASLLKEVSTVSSTVTALEKKGFIRIIDEEVKRNPITKAIPNYPKVKLTEKQQACFDSIYSDMKYTKNNKFLIHGVTGSGKTEIYLQLIEKVLENKKQAIVLVPEISLTPQTVERFVGRFGNRVAVLHSRLSLGERFDEWQRIREGTVDIVVGARSAIFAPFKDLGLIIIDEEHETSYKSSMNPKYNTIEVAEKRCELENAALVLGSATPSIESYYRAKEGEMKLLTLSTRVLDRQLPPIEVVDMTEELEKGNKSIFSESLYDSIKENLKNKKQTILFLNRRGFSTFVSCRKCGYVVKCSDCDISMTYHISKNILKCHYCGLAKKPPTVCPECGSKYIKYFGIGTQKVEELVKKSFPEARIARMDVDNTTKKGSHEAILSRVKNGEVDILIGTQMISKGLDFPNVTLVGVIAADISLNLPDFKSSERTFQLIAQVSGRAGRGESKGKVILQTYEPEHYSIQTAQDHDYISFYEKEIILRKAFNYPPFYNIIGITIIGQNQGKVSIASRKLAGAIGLKIKERKLNFSNDNILGPNPAPISRIKSNYRWQIIIKCRDFEMDVIKGIIEEVCITDWHNEEYDEIRFNIDINPISIM